MKGIKVMRKQQRYNDPTCIQYFFYFADELQQLLADHNALSSDLNCPPLTEEKLQEHIAEMGEGEEEPYCILHCHPPIICLLHAVKDTLIWQVSYSGGEEASDPEEAWRAAMQIPWGEIQYAYGATTLFVVNVRRGKLQDRLIFFPLIRGKKSRNLLDNFNHLYTVLREVIASLPNEPTGGEAEGEIGYLRWLDPHGLMLLVREGSEDTGSAVFQCATFPRMEMQRHKACHYARLAQQSAELIRQVVQPIIDSASTLHALYGLSSRHLKRLVEVSLTDITVMQKNIQRAQESFQMLKQEGTKGRLEGRLWEQVSNRIEVNLKDAEHAVQEVRRLIDSLASISNGTGSSLDERIRSLSNEVDEAIRTELRQMLDTLRQRNQIGVLTQLTRTCLKFMNLLFEKVGRTLPAGKGRPSDNLYDCILRAHKGRDENPNFKHKGLCILPDEIASCLHTIRTYSNKADHDAEKTNLTVEDAENMLGLFLRVLEWFYCEYENGPRLKTIYADGSATT